MTTATPLGLEHGNHHQISKPENKNEASYIVAELGRVSWEGVPESAWLPPCVVLVINDNLYGLMFALRYLHRSCPWEKIGVHVLDSRRVYDDQAIIYIKRRR